MSDWDVIVVGARCAGAATACQLARRGHRVLLLDKARFPSEIPHGHFIHWCGPRRLQSWGLLERVTRSNCPPVSRMISDLGDYALRASDLVVDGVAWGYAPRRKVIDQILIDAAIEAGAEFRDGFSVEGFLSDAGRIAGVRGRHRGGSLELRAKLTIGADGRSSLLARHVAAPEYHVAPAKVCYYFSYWADVAHSGFEVYQRGRRVLLAHPTNDGLFTVFAGWPVAEHATLREDVQGAFDEALARVPELAERVRAGRRVERLYGAVHLPNFFRQASGEGWALVGDAGHHQDPYLALGISDALRDAQFLAEDAHRGLAGEAQLDDALVDYGRRRDAAALPRYQLNLKLAELGEPSPEQRAMRAAVRDRPEDARQYVLALFGLVPREQFFNPANLERLGLGPR